MKGNTLIASEVNVITIFKTIGSEFATELFIL